MYLNSIQIIGFIGKDPERRQRQDKGAAYTVFSVATQRSWKNAAGEWQNRTEWHRVVAWNAVGERAADRLHSGDHVYIHGQLVSSTYDRQSGDAENPTVVKRTFWQVRAGAIRKLDRAGNQPGAPPLAATPASPDADDIPF